MQKKDSDSSIKKYNILDAIGKNEKQDNPFNN